MQSRVPPERDAKLLEEYLRRKVAAHVRGARERIEQKLQASLAGTHQRLAESMLRRYTQLMARAGFSLQIADPAVPEKEPAAPRSPAAAGRVSLRY